MTPPPPLPPRRGRPPQRLFRPIPLTDNPWIVYTMDKTTVRGGKQGTGLSAQAAHGALDARGKLGMLRFSASAPTLHHLIDDSACNLYLSMGNDRRQALSRFWQRVREPWIGALRWGHRILGGRQAFVGDGALMQEQCGVDSHVCPVCCRSQDLYLHDPSARTIPMPSDHVYQMHGIGFVHTFGIPGALFDIDVEILPPYAVVWGPLHCFSNAFSTALAHVLDILDNRRAGAGAKWAADFAEATSLRGGRPFDRRIKLSFGEFDSLYRNRSNIPSSDDPCVDAFIFSFFTLYGIWRSSSSAEHPCDVQHDAAQRFFDFAKRVRALHVQLFPRMTPSAHNIYDHLGAQWLVSGQPLFPMIVSDQGPESTHKPLKRRWVNSVMITRDRFGRTGLHECVRAEWTPRLLAFLDAASCDRDPRAFQTFLNRVGLG